jgi:hypothetical protein
MPAFPTLSTGAVAQYPLARGTSYAVETIQFLDGSQQRCLTRGKSLRSWLVSLGQLTETELSQIEQFFDACQGGFNTFTFTDPGTGQAVPNCRISNPEAVTQYLASGSGKASLVIEEIHV